MSVTNSQLIRMLEADAKYERARLAKIAANDAKVAAELEVHEALEGAGDVSITRDLGPPWGVYTFVPNETIYSDIYDYDAFEAWTRENHRAVEFIGEPAPRKQPLNQFVRRVLKTKGMEMPAGVQHKRTRYVTATSKAKK